MRRFNMFGSLQGMNKFNNLSRILCYDDFDRGFCGWTDLMPNFTEPGFRARKSIVEKTQWPPIMLSSATFRYPGTHGSMDGVYSLKVSTRDVANPYKQPPAPGSMGQAIKRMSFHADPGKRQLEMWYAYTPEQDRIGLGQNDIRAFGVFFDIQDDAGRYFLGTRYLNSIEGKPVRKWQFMQASDVTDTKWAYGTEGDWCKKGIDPQWYGERYDDGSADGFRFIPKGKQQLCYNESDDKINWLYFRLLFDTKEKKYIELQSQDEIFDMRGLSPTIVKPYNNIDGLFNGIIWVEADTNRRVFLYVDSLVISYADGETT
jgi:hypothetical protein